MKPPHKDYECPKCGEWITILESTPESFDCPWCKEPLLFDADAEGSFADGSWRDLSKLISARPHMEAMLKHAKVKNVT